MTLVQSEPKAIKIGIPGGDDYSAMQGPAPDGFHVPLNTEWQAVYKVWTALGGGSSDGTNFGIALKLPFAGRRNSTSAGVIGQDSDGLYWSSSRYNTNDAYRLRFNSTTLSPRSASSRALGYSVRAFKNSPVVPKSSWTKLYGTSIENGGIFWNSTDGLISLSSDGTTWITIMDKNLGATQVWNNGNTLSQANCGKYYQRGNNYGFPFTGSVTTSSTRVNASTYGPGNYYSSSTFIMYNGAWDSSDNGNLWGGETGVIQIPDTEIKAVYLGTTKVRPPINYKTFTITRTEKSDMSSGWTYSDDAAGLTAGDTAFDEFFGYYGCRLNASGVETAKITQEQSGGNGKLDITQLGTLTSGDNVMIAFPVRGIKMTKSGSTVTLSITDGLGRESEGYQYYAHCTGTLSNPGTPNDVMYLGAYKGYSSSNVIKSWSGQSPTVSQTQSTFITRAKANGSGYNIIGFYQRMFVNCLYMMKYGSPDSQTKVGKGYTGGSAKKSTGGTNSQTNATYGTTSTTVQAKLFGLEDWWGNINEWIGGMCTDGSKNLWTALSGFTGAVTTSSPYENTGTTIQSTGSGYDLSSIVGSNKGLFAPTATVSNSNYDTYYCDYVYVDASCLAYAGGGWSYGSYAGAFHLVVVLSASDAGRDVGARLMYL